jgi:hypothetical protein
VGEPLEHEIRRNRSDGQRHPDRHAQASFTCRRRRQSDRERHPEESDTVAVVKKLLLLIILLGLGAFAAKKLREA